MCTMILASAVHMEVRQDAEECQEPCQSWQANKQQLNLLVLYLPPPLPLPR